MSYNVESFKSRAEECVRLANLAKDSMVQRELLALRQVYLRTATRLQELQGATPQKE
jgi:hypothetical protein